MYVGGNTKWDDYQQDCVLGLKGYVTKFDTSSRTISLTKYFNNYFQSNDDVTVWDKLSVFNISV